VIIPEDFWSPRSAYYPESAADDYIYPPFDKDTLEVCQERLGVILPNSLIMLLKSQNGGGIEYINVGPAKNPDPIEIQGIPAITKDFASFYGLRTYEIDFGFTNDPNNDRVMAELGAKIARPDRLVLLEKNPQYLIALDYRRCEPVAEPPIIYMDLYDDIFSYEVIADDFEQFLLKLTKPNV